MNKRSVFKLVTVIGAPTVLLVSVELALALAGYRTTYER